MTPTEKKAREIKKKQIRMELREIKSLMKFHKPTIGFLGSQYYYWENKRNEKLKELEKL